MFSHQIVCFGEGASPSIGRVDICNQHIGYTYVQDSSCTFSLVKNEEIFPLEELLPPIEEVVEKWNRLTDEQKIKVLDAGMLGNYIPSYSKRDLVLININGELLEVLDISDRKIREIHLENFHPDLSHASTLRNIVARIIESECQSA